MMNAMAIGLIAIAVVAGGVIFFMENFSGSKEKKKDSATDGNDEDQKSDK